MLRDSPERRPNRGSVLVESLTRAIFENLSKPFRVC